jgi:ATP-dependent DNA helicase RecQ
MSQGADLDAALARFCHDAFRPGQREAIETLLEQRRLLLVAPTGGGKSLTYQLPASLLGGTNLVVSPLIALMQDQVGSLDRVGVRATYLASTLPAAEIRQRAHDLAKGAYDLAYVAPERLAMSGFRSLLRDLDCPLLAIDEAHCISEWGHDFRPEYMQIGEVLPILPEARVLACTATATPVVRDEILGRLGLPADTPQVLRGFARPNLSFRACETQGKKDREQLVDVALAEALERPGAGKGCAIVYSPTRRMAEEESQRLAERGWSVGCYHAGLAASTRESTQTAFIGKRLEVMVATNAFGMGIDRADVRAVVHLGPPGSLEAWYQEVGRAGRDGERALGLLLHAPNDFPVRRNLIERGNDDQIPTPEVVEHKWNLFLELMRWAEGGSCRHDAVLRYFGDEAETLEGCGICDVCQEVSDAGEHDPEEVTLIVRKALSGVARVHGRYGISAAAKLLRGDPDERLMRAGLDRYSTFGVLSDRSEAWLQRLLRRLVTAGWVSFEGGDRPVAVLTEMGRRVMQGDVPARMVLPPEKVRRVVASGARSTGRSSVAAEPELDPVGQALFEALREWRLETARSAGVPPYVVGADRSLREIAMLRPRNRDELLLCHGIGPAKAERYGTEIVALVCEATPDPG